MLEDTAEHYSQYVKLDMPTKLLPITQSIDDMLTRLEEFETMVAVVQKERCSSIGLTGSLLQVAENLSELKDLCKRIDIAEELIEHAKKNVDDLENKIEIAEVQYGLVDNTNKIKNLFAPIFKKSATAKVNPSNTESDIFCTEDYFNSEINAQDAETEN